MNTGTQPEYNVGYRYPYLKHEVTTHDLGGPKDRSNSPGWSPTGNPYEAEDLSSKLSGFFGGPVRGLMNAGINRYNSVRDYMETPGQSEPAAVMTPGGGQSVHGAQSQQGYIQHENTNKITAPKVRKEEWSAQDDMFVRDVLGINPEDTESAKKFQAFMLNSNFDLGEFGQGGLDGNFGDMTRGAARKLGTLLSSSSGINQLKQSSPYMQEMWMNSARKAGRGATQAQIDQQFALDVVANIQRSDPSSWNPALASGTQGRKGEKTQGYGATAVQQGNNTSNKDAYEKSSDEGAKTYKDKEGVERKTGKQGAKYENRKKKKPITKKKIKRTSATYSDGRNKKEFDAAYAKAKKAGKTVFTFSNGKKYSTDISAKARRKANTRSVGTIKSRGIKK
jgi:hypothetical protein